METNWKKLAEKAVQEGYQQGNQWETSLRKSLEPELMTELGPDLDSFLIARTHRAQMQFETLTEQGTDPQTAKELVQSELLGESQA